MKHDYLGRSTGKFPGATEKVILFFRTECSKWKFVFYFFKAIFDTSFRPSWSIELIYMYKMVNAILRRNLPFLTLRTIYPNREPTGLPMWMLNNRTQSVKSPVSDHPKCEDLVVAYRKWSFTRGFNCSSCCSDLVACVASVSSRGSSTKLGQEGKKSEWRGRGREASALTFAQ